jgi:hypothetical protein
MNGHGTIVLGVFPERGEHDVATAGDGQRVGGCGARAFEQEGVGGVVAEGQGGAVGDGFEFDGGVGGEWFGFGGRDDDGGLSGLRQFLGETPDETPAGDREDREDEQAREFRPLEERGTALHGRSISFAGDELVEADLGVLLGATE